MYGPPRGFARNRQEVAVDAELCVGCLDCIRQCPHRGILRATKEGGRLVAEAAEPKRCVGCMRCLDACAVHAIRLSFFV